ncbi:probable nucleoredoxin 1-1 [Phoenix dactylifera]|uniref:protein-disulfide reductase n=1 Tax=Phoenix dactylifera TaxID=42345 RepID=A0A8B7BPK0_PHODC|nr:probable nucleoredoxin 1-1 [Phoenix dactylifera]
MAGVGGDDNGAACRHDLKSLLAADERDFLVRNNGDQVKIANLEGKTIGLYFSASWCPPCRRFTPKLIETYGKLSSEGKDFEVVFVSADRDEDSFNGYFAKMPWLAIPFSDTKARDRLDEVFKVRGIPHLVILDASGEVLNEEGVQAVGDYGSEGYPFTLEKINKLKEDEEAAKREQTLQTVLVSPSRDYLILNNGNQVPVSELEGKIVCLYFSVSGFQPCDEFTLVLAKIYRTLKEKGESFEVVMVSLDDEESSFKEGFAGMPWLAIPFGDESCKKLVRYFELRTIPTLVVLGSDGKTLHSNIAELVEEHGEEAWEGFPFSQDKMDLLAEKAKAKLAAQSLESLLVSGEIDYVIGKDGVQIPVSELMGKNILLYFSAQWCGPCRAFLPKLIEEYRKIKDKDSAFEVVFISSDRDQKSFEDFFSGMPWLALPFGDERKKSLNRVFKIRGIPSLVAIGPTGRTVTKDAKLLLMIHGADAYPFTEERIKELEDQLEEMAKGWPEKLKHDLHEEHELVLIRCGKYGCDGCDGLGDKWSYRCTECNFDLHPRCALAEDKKKTGEEDHGEEQGKTEEGYVCDGDACRKA